MITVIGLGVSKGDLSLRAYKVLKEANCVLVRNECPASETLREEKIPYRTLDHLFEKCRNFDTLTKNLVAEVKKSGDEVCYCVEGGVFEDRAARILIESGANFLDGISKSERAASLANLKGAYSAVSAFELGEKRFCFPLVCYDLADRSLASDVKLLLSERMSEEEEVLFLDGDVCEPIKLYELDRRKNYTPRCALVVCEKPLLEKKRFDFEDVVEILKRLRAPDGCPWDRVQTHESIRMNAIEEAYELVDAIDLKDPDKICEEAGDVLMQALFHTLIEEENKRFSVCDMLTGLCEKLISRHTHVFGADRAEHAEGALSVWEKNKMKEKHQATFSDSVNDVPRCFPALLRAQKICKRVEKGLPQKVSAEELKRRMDALFEAINCKDGVENPEKLQERIGEFLLCAAFVCHAEKADGEMALFDAGERLQRKFTAYETLVRADGKDPLSLSQEEQNEYFRRVENGENDEHCGT